MPWELIVAAQNENESANFEAYKKRTYTTQDDGSMRTCNSVCPRQEKKLYRLLDDGKTKKSRITRTVKKTKIKILNDPQNIPTHNPDYTNPRSQISFNQTQQQNNNNRSNLPLNINLIICITPPLQQMTDKPFST